MAANFSNKKNREDFVSNLEGTTLHENYLLIILPLLLQLCHSVWTLNLFQLGYGDFKGSFILNFLTVALTLILSITVLCEYLLEVCFIVFILCLIGAINSLNLSRATKYNIEIRTTVHNPSSDVQKIGHLFTSQVRGCVLLSGAICILAVDMKIFPRRWAKTESYGTGVMDLGVGTFALLMGLMWPSCVNRARFLRQFAILLILGTFRLMVLKNLNYQEHKSEYGRHWNFFFTLAIVKLIGTVLTRISSSISRVVVAVIIIGSMQHLFLQNLGYENICLENTVDRDSSLFVANKEGIISICGYIVLWLIGRLLSQLMKYTRIWYVILSVWCILAHIMLDWKYLTVSRRSANLAYVIWTSSCVSCCIVVLFCGDILLNGLEDRANYVNKLECPDLYCIVNRRGLLHFLLANVLTGVVNLSIDTLNLSATYSVVVLSVYTAVPLIIIHVIDLYHRRNGHKDD